MGAGKPRSFNSGDDITECFREFCEDIRRCEYNRYPSQTNFCAWLAEQSKPTDRKTIYLSVNKYYPSIKKNIEILQSDLLAEGAAMGRWKESITIFTLKNWCKWTDKQDIGINNVDNKPFEVNIKVID